MRKLSFCTVCMNRLTHLRETLPLNLAGNAHHPGIEFVILDYNSGDGMEDWARENLSDAIAAGVLKYYKTYEPQYFNPSKSKNLVARLASGDVVCLIDADNFAGKDYAAWVQSVFDETGDDALVTTLRKDKILLRDQGGKLCFLKSHFMNIHGFDEGLEGYGMDDVDLALRLEKAGARRVFIEDEKYLRFIGHSDVERLANHLLFHNLDMICRQVSASRITRLLFIMKDGSFLEINGVFNNMLKTDLMQSYVGWTMPKEGLLNGTYQRRDAGLVLQFDNGTAFTLRQEDPDAYSSLEEGEKQTWNKIPRNEQLFYAMMMAYEECFNRNKCTDNESKSAVINPNGWGKGTVYLNFDRNNPILV
jgi:glycosyl transferase family 7 (putative galactosyltransferase)